MGLQKHVMRCVGRKEEINEIHSGGIKRSRKQQ